MTISTETDKVTHAGNGVATSFTYPFKIFVDSDLVVTHVVDASGVETVMTLNTDYTVTGAGDASGSITYPVSGSPLPGGESLVLTSDIPLTQSTDLKNQGTFYNQVHEDFFDKIIRIAQQLKEIISRAPVVPVSTTLSSNQLPSPSAGKAIGWNNTADGFTNLADLTGTVVTPFADNLLDDTSAAEARTTLGVAFSGSETVVTPATDDHFSLLDTSDANNAKRSLISGLFTLFKGEANSYTGHQFFGTATVTDAATITWDCSTQQVGEVTLAANRTLDPANYSDGGVYVLFVNAAGFTFTYAADIDVSLMSGGVAPTMGAAVNVFTFFAENGKLYMTDHKAA